MATSVYANTVYDFKTTLALVAEASEREQQAQALLQRWETRVADFRQQIADQLGGQWPQKVAVVRFKSDHVRIYTSGFAGSILDELGFEQPETLASQDWGMKLASTENIPVLEADVIFVLLEPDDPAIAANYQHWASHPLWQQLTAVQRGQVFEADPVSWMMGGGILAANAMLDDLYRYYQLTPATDATCHTALYAFRAALMLNSSSAKWLGLLAGAAMTLLAFIGSVMLGHPLQWSALWRMLTAYDPANVAHIILYTERLPRAVVAALWVLT